MQAAVHGGLHAAGVGTVVSHGAVAHAVLGRRLGRHILVGFVKLAALGVDGLNQLSFALVLEAAQPIGKGAVNHAGRTALAIGTVRARGRAHAVLHAAAPEHILEGDGIIVDVKGRKQGFDVADELGVLCRFPIVGLRLCKFAGVAFGDSAPVILEVAAAAGVIIALRIVGVGVVKGFAEIFIHGVVRLLQPVHKADNGALHEHVDAVGCAAAVAGNGGDVAGVGTVARLVILAQVAQLRTIPAFARGNQYRGDAAHQHHRRQDQCHAPFCPFHVKYPALSVSCMERFGRGKMLLHRFT